MKLRIREWERSLRGPAYLLDHWRPFGVYVCLELTLGFTLGNHPEQAIQVRDKVAY